MKMKSYTIVLSLALTLLICLQIIAASKSNNAPIDTPAVIMAAAPTYPLILKAKGAKGNVLVQVSVKADGSVDSAKAISGHPLLHRASEEAAKRWRFVSSTEASSKRTTIITFTFTPMPKHTPIGDLTPIFYPPYKVEVRNSER